MHYAPIYVTICNASVFRKAIARQENRVRPGDAGFWILIWRWIERSKLVCHRNAACRISNIQMTDECCNVDVNAWLAEYRGNTWPAIVTGPSVHLDLVLLPHMNDMNASFNYSTFNEIHGNYYVCSVCIGSWHDLNTKSESEYTQYVWNTTYICHKFVLNIT